MIAVDQTKIGESGNCFQASIASILEVRLDEVPDFYNQYAAEVAHVRFTDWLIEKHGLFPITVYAGSEVFEKAAQCTCEATVKSIDHPGLDHSVVVSSGKIWHDPHPSKRSLELTLADVKQICLFAVYDQIGDASRDKFWDRVARTVEYEERYKEAVEKIKSLRKASRRHYGELVELHEEIRALQSENTGLKELLKEEQ